MPCQAVYPESPGWHADDPGKRAARQSKPSRPTRKAAGPAEQAKPSLADGSSSSEDDKEDEDGDWRGEDNAAEAGDPVTKGGIKPEGKTQKMRRKVTFAEPTPCPKPAEANEKAKELRGSGSQPAAPSKPSLLAQNFCGMQKWSLPFLLCIH